MTEHHVIISAWDSPAGARLSISCSCGETLLADDTGISVIDAGNIRWEHLGWRAGSGKRAGGYE